MKIHKAKPRYVKEAKESAKKRRDFHRHFGSKRHWHDKKKGEYTDEYYGSLAQIVFRERIEELGISSKAEFCSLYTDDLSSLPDWDAKIGKTTIEIKAIPPDDEYVKRIRMLVKVSEFKSQDIYVAVKFMDQITYYFCGYATKEELSKIVPKSYGFAPAYGILLKDLPHRLRGKWWEE